MICHVVFNLSAHFHVLCHVVFNLSAHFHALCRVVCNLSTRYLTLSMSFYLWSTVILCWPLIPAFIFI
jgi:hypothetical protein